MTKDQLIVQLTRELYEYKNKRDILLDILEKLPLDLESATREQLISAINDIDDEFEFWEIYCVDRNKDIK